MKALFIRLLIMVIVDGAFLCSYLFVLWVKMKRNGACHFWIIRARQQVVAFAVGSFIWSVFSIVEGIIAWFISFFIMRYFFKADAHRLQYLFETYEAKNKPYPVMNKMTQLREVFSVPSKMPQIRSEFQYTLQEHSKSILSLVILFICGVACVSTHAVLYFVEGLILATAIFVFIGRWIYRIYLHNPGSLWFLSPGLAYIPVVVYGIAYYFIAFVVLWNTCP